MSRERSGSESYLTEPTRAKKRKRPISVTCEACKQRKVKCDRVRPSCGWCARNFHACEYKERKTPGLRAGYGKDLEARLDKLEAIIDEQKRQLADHLSIGCTITTAVPDRINTNSNVPHQCGANSCGTQLIRRPRMSNNLAGDLVADYPQTSSLKTHSGELTSVGVSIPGAVLEQSSQSYAQTLLPSHDILHTLVDLYFKHINIWLPILDHNRTLDLLTEQHIALEANQILLHSIVAVTLRFSPHHYLDSERRQQYYTIPKQKVQLYGLENSSVRSLQALVILALDMTGNTNGPPAWNMLSLASRMVVQLGLAAEVGSPLHKPTTQTIATLRAAVLAESESFIEEEERRRLFWAIYFLDRYATIATAFEFALADKDIDRKLPCRNDLFSLNRAVNTRRFGTENSARCMSTMDDVHDHFSYHCELLDILGKIHLFLKRPLDVTAHGDVQEWRNSYQFLETTLRRWHSCLPHDVTSIDLLCQRPSENDSSTPGWLMIQAAYHLTIIRLNSSAAYPAQTAPTFLPSHTAVQRCLAAVDNLRTLGRFVKDSGLLDEVGVPFAFASWVAARVMLVHGSTVDHQIDPAIEFFILLLDDMGKLWSAVRRYREILSRVLQEYRDSRNEFANTSIPPTVQILADMRRCAFDLDVLITQQAGQDSRSHQQLQPNISDPNNWEYLDIFDLFNFPRVLTPQINLIDQPQGIPVGQTAYTIRGDLARLDFAVPDPGLDWISNSL